jgi:hypothetical protein
MQNPEKLLEKHTNVVLARLEAIKTMVDNNSFTAMVHIKKEIKGSYKLYDILSAKRILYKNPHDRIIYWDMKVKITKHLARTIAIEITEKNKKYANVVINNAVVASKSKKPMVKSNVSMSFFWGLFTFTKD